MIEYDTLTVHTFIENRVIKHDIDDTVLKWLRIVVFYNAFNVYLKDSILSRNNILNDVNTFYKSMSCVKLEVYYNVRYRTVEIHDDNRTYLYLTI